MIEKIWNKTSAYPIFQVTVPTDTNILVVIHMYIVSRRLFQGPASLIVVMEIHKGNINLHFLSHGLPLRARYAGRNVISSDYWTSLSWLTNLIDCERHLTPLEITYITLSLPVTTLLTVGMGFSHVKPVRNSFPIKSGQIFWQICSRDRDGIYSEIISPYGKGI